LAKYRSLRISALSLPSQSFAERFERSLSLDSDHENFAGFPAQLAEQGNGRFSKTEINFCQSIDRENLLFSIHALQNVPSANTQTV
jgi:hypothetical protein